MSIEEQSISGIVRLRLIVQNNRLKVEIKSSGYTMEALAKKSGINYTYLSEIVNLRRLPSEEQIISIAIALQKPIDYLFPETLLESVRRKTFANRIKLLDEEKVKKITGPPLLLLYDGDINKVEEKLDSDSLKIQVVKALSTLKPRERRVLSLRYGLDDGISRTLAEVGKEFNVTPARIRQIEAKALRKLRHPSRSLKLKKVFFETAD